MNVKDAYEPGEVVRLPGIDAVDAEAALLEYWGDMLCDLIEDGLPLPRPAVPGVIRHMTALASLCRGRPASDLLLEEEIAAGVEVPPFLPATIVFLQVLANAATEVDAINLRGRLGLDNVPRVLRLCRLFVDGGMVKVGPGTRGAFDA